MPAEQRHAGYGMQSSGYMRWTGKYSVDDNASVYVHRLLAVAKYGFSDVADRVVHHKNTVPWDNRPDNIEVMTQSDHASQHNTKLSEGDCREIRRAYHTNSDLTQTDLAEKYGVDDSHISRIVRGKCRDALDNRGES